LRRVEALATRRPRATPWRSALLATLLSFGALLTQWSRIAAATEPTLASHPRAQPSAGAAVRALASVVMPMPMPAAVLARHALVVDEDSGQVLMARDADRVVPIASLTKLVTAMVVLDARLPPAQPVRIGPADVDWRLHSPSTLAVGARMTRADALVMALLASDNRAAAALARTYPGGPAAFDQALQGKIRALGLARTTLQEPTGLSSANASTAAEMARIVMASARYPEIAAITAEREADVVVDGRVRHLRNHNPLVGAAGWQIRLSKTGFTRAAGDCLTMRLRAGSRDVTVVLLDTHDDAQRLRDAHAIQQALAPAAAI
jgi:D-alanyl-D-alanine endopeptidase (penicillin-binding protein 7)